MERKEQIQPHTALIRRKTKPSGETEGKEKKCPQGEREERKKKKTNAAPSNHPQVWKDNEGTREEKKGTNQGEMPCPYKGTRPSTGEKKRRQEGTRVIVK